MYALLESAPEIKLEQGKRLIKYTLYNCVTRSEPIRARLKRLKHKSLSTLPFLFLLSGISIMELKVVKMRASYASEKKLKLFPRLDIIKFDTDTGCGRVLIKKNSGCYM